MVVVGGVLAAITSFVIAVGRLTHLVEGTEWLPTILIGAMVAVAVSLGTRALGWGRPLEIGLHLITMIWYSFRVMSPDTMVFGLIPTSATSGSALEELGYGIELLRFGAAPVLAAPGLIALISIACWALAAATTTGLLSRRFGLAITLNLIFYLQLSTVDRTPSPTSTMAVMALLTVTAIVLLGARTRRGGANRPDGSALPRRSPGLALVTGILATAMGLGAPQLVGAKVPEGGTIAWRSPTGLGGLYGGNGPSPFVGLRQSVVDLSEDPVFIATVSDSAPPPEQMYWNLITLDYFDGTNWLPSALSSSARGAAWEDETLRFSGPTVRVSARVRITGLGGQMLPTLYSPVSLTSEIERISDGFLVRADGSIRLDLSLRQGWEYEFEADLPHPDIAALATVGDRLSPVLENSAAITGLRPSIDTPAETITPNPNIYLQLPTRFPAKITALAKEATKGTTTDFERALFLEAFFRDHDFFTYSTDVSTGHSSLDLEDWLLDPDSRNFRTGYCEQFATAMAVMARSINIPARVVLGFTPGQAQQQADGSEIIVVRARNAHAWVEMWMDGQGWVRFDPTPRTDGANPSFVAQAIGLDPRNYLQAPDNPGASGPTQSRTNPRLNLPDVDTRDIPSGLAPGGATPRLPPAMVWLVLSAGVIGATPITKWVARKRRMRRLRGGDITAAWEEVMVRLADLGEPIPGHRSPMELASDHGPDLVPLAAMVTTVVSGGEPAETPDHAFATADAWIGARGTRLDHLRGWMVPSALRRRR